MLVVSAALPIGCETASPPSLQQAYADHAAGRHAQACAAASRVAASHSGRVGEEAAYLAGQACAKVGKTAEAERHLIRATRSGDRTLAGQAMAELGLLYERTKRYDRAAPMFEQAAARLTGRDKAHAYLHAGIAQQRLGQWDRARRNLTLARASSSDATIRQQADARLNATGYTIQVGAFSDSANAQRLARSVAGRATSLGYGPPRIARSPDGKLLRVQVGRFQTLVQADAARLRLGQSGSVVVTLGQ